MSDDQNTSGGSELPTAEPSPAVDGGGATDSPQADQAEISPADGQADRGAEAPAASAEAPTLTIAAPAPDPEGDARRGTIHTLVEEWWGDHFPGSVVGRSTEIWNYVHGAKEALKAKLDNWTSAPPPPAA